jgi:hypothetical protein
MMERMLSGRLITESLRLEAVLSVPDLRLGSLRRVDVSGSVAPAQPKIWTFLDFEAPDEVADILAARLASALEREGGWYADFSVGNEHVVVYAGRVFRYLKGDQSGRAAAQQHGRTMGVPERQLDWPD